MKHTNEVAQQQDGSRIGCRRGEKVCRRRPFSEVQFRSWRRAFTPFRHAPLGLVVAISDRGITCTASHWVAAN